MTNRVPLVHAAPSICEAVLDGGHVHAECAVLAHLDTFLHANPSRKDELIPYIGTSKRPCPLCGIYIDVFNAATSHNMRAVHTDGQMVGWRRPHLTDPGREETIRVALRQRLANTLCDKITSLARELISSHDTGVPERRRRDEVDDMSG